MHADQEEEFRERVLNRAAWVSAATALMETADLLEWKVDRFWTKPESSLHSRWKPLKDEYMAVYLMLYSFAIENLLKAHLIRQNYDAVVDALKKTPELPRFLRGHDLYDLFRKAGFENMAIKHELVIHRMSRAAIWYGRYSTPVNAVGLARGRESPNLAPNQAGLWGYAASDPASAYEIAQTLLQSLEGSDPGS